jgi:ubiquinone/menaquinone biosynthesis C-methylase UbiE
VEDDVKNWLKEEGERFLKDVGVKKGQIVVDFGCSVGHYTIPAAKIVGRAGRVYAVDKGERALNQLMKDAGSERIGNIVPRRTLSELKLDLKGKSVDVVLFYDVLHYMSPEERRRTYDEVRRFLKNGGLLSVYPKHHKSDEPLWDLADMELEDIIEEIENADFCLERKLFKKLIHDGSYNKGYVLNFRKV